jgi:hypothetical protein
MQQLLLPLQQDSSAAGTVEITHHRRSRYHLQLLMRPTLRCLIAAFVRCWFAVALQGQDC